MTTSLYHQLLGETALAREDDARPISGSSISGETGDMDRDRVDEALGKL